MQSFLKRLWKKDKLPWILVVILSIYSIFVTIDRADYYQRMRAYEKMFEAKIPKTTATTNQKTIGPLQTARPLTNPYQGTVSDLNKIKKDLDVNNLEIKIVNIIDDYAFITEHSLPPGGGGGWSVIINQSGIWKRLFTSSDEIFCPVYDEYNLPKGLLGDCDN